MVIRELKIIQFRNYKTLETEFNNKLNWIQGDNGQGKTNLAEAIYYACNLDSFRTRNNKDLLKEGFKFSHILCRIEKLKVLHNIKITISRQGRSVFLNKSSFKKVSDYVMSFLALSLIPEEITIFRRSPSEKRRFFNRTQSIVDESFFKLLKDYNKTLAQKNAVLKKNDRKNLSLWNDLLAINALKIVKKRKNFSKEINKIMPKIFKQLSGRLEVLQIKYKPSITVAENEEAFVKEIENHTDKEFNIGFSTIGPHRDDFQLKLDYKDDRKFFSQGEFRLTNLALKLTINKLMYDISKIYPILILDDVFSELDSKKRSKIIDYLHMLNNQTFITSTNNPDKNFSGKIFKISQGRII